MSFSTIIQNAVDDTISKYIDKISIKYKLDKSELSKIWNNIDVVVQAKEENLPCDDNKQKIVNALTRLTKPELVELCKTKGLKTSGTKTQLIELLSNEEAKKLVVKTSNEEKVTAKLVAKIPSISIKRNQFQNFEHEETSFVFDNKEKKVYGKQNPDGSIAPLTKEDINLCNKYKFSYIIPDNLDTKNNKIDEELEDLDEIENDDEEDEEEEEDLEEEFSDSDYNEKLPVHDLGFMDEVPDEELLKLIGGEEERDEADLDLGSDQILPDPEVPGLKEEEEKEEEDEEDMEKFVNEALTSIKKRNKKFKSLKEESEEEMKEEEEEEEDHEEEMKEAYGSEEDEKKEMHESSHEDEEEMKEAYGSEEDEKKEMHESLNTLFKGQKLSEGFKRKTATIFEAVVREKIASEREKIREAYKIAYKKQSKLKEDRIVNKLSSYLDYAVSEWLKENKVAVDRSIESRIAENFMSGMKDLFEKHYVEVPKNKKDLVKGLTKRTKELENRLNEQTKKNIHLTKTLKETSKSLIVKKACEGLTSSDSERLVSLTENLAFTNKKDFAEKVLTIKKSFFAKGGNKTANKRMITSGMNLTEQTGESNYEVEQYIDAFKKRNL